MKIPFNKTFQDNSEVLLRRSGYARQDDYKTEKISYFRSLGSQHFPKFHVYVDSDSPLTLDLHLDQKKYAYEGQKAHGGEYDGDTVRAEALRLWNAVLAQQANVAPAVKKVSEDDEEKKGFFGRLFS